MNKSRFFLILCGLVLLTATQAQAQGASWQEATTILNNQTVSTNFENGDIHWYKIVLSDRASVRFVLQTDNVVSVGNLELYAIVDETIDASCRNSTWGGCDVDFKINDIAIGTYYLKIPRSKGYGDYTLNYKYAPPSLPEDAEINDDWTQAIELIDGDVVSGQLGYNHAGTTNMDAVDWYKVTLNGNAAVQFVMETDNVLSIGNLELYATEDGTIGASARNSVSAGYSANFKINDLSVGTYYLKMPRNSGYGSYTLSYKIFLPEAIDDTGIKTVKMGALQIYPNPVKDEIFIKSELQITKIEILDFAGRTVETLRATSLQTINVSALSPGVYMLMIYTDNGIVVKKVVKI